MAVCNLGTTIIDHLVICFIATPVLLASLRELSSINYGDFRLSRIEGRFHRHYFTITTNGIRKLGYLYFDRFASDGNELYLWLDVIMRPRRITHLAFRKGFSSLMP